ncbi:FAD-dependent oxidoreductase [Streptomyces sp. NPDC059009]|uniref:FAD-dependent oxidoreductase n=1 Tax=Streptomyces sp. NPDC059009 TaxID=3346694 RepID=UPI0036AE1188
MGRSGAHVPAGARVAVVGAGIAGLAAAFRLQRAGCDVTVLDTAPRELVGGRMASQERDGFHVDLGAPLLGRRYRRMRSLIADAGLEGEVLPAADLTGTAYEGRVHRGRTGSPLRLLGGGLLHGVPLTDRRQLLTELRKLRPVLHPDDMSAAAAHDTESVYRYALRRGLSTRTVEHLLDPLGATLCLTDPEDTAQAAPFLYLAFLLTSGGYFTSVRGSGFLPQGLARTVPVRHGTRVVAVAAAGAEVHVTSRCPARAERSDAFEGLVLAVPPTLLPAIWLQLPPELKELCRATRYGSAVQVTFCLDRPTTEHAVMVHTPRAETPDLGGCVLPHNLSPLRVPPGRGMITAYLRGEASRRLWDGDDAEAADRVLAGLAALGVLPEAGTHCETVHVDRIPNCVVRRAPGDYRRVARAAASYRPGGGRIQLAGGDLFGHSTTIGSLTSGEEAARRLLAELRPAPSRTLGSRTPRTERPAC